MESLESEDELAAILAREIAHVESRDCYRLWRNARTAAAWAGLAAALAGASDNNADDIAAAMLSFTTNLFLAGMDATGSARRTRSPASICTKRTSATALSSRRSRSSGSPAMLYDPFGNGVGGLFATHPHIDERLAKPSATETRPFADTELFHGFDENGSYCFLLRRWSCFCPG